MSNSCKICGENVGYLGKIVEFIYYKIFRLKMFKHKCKVDPPIVDPNTGQINLRYNPIHMEVDYFLYTRAEPEEKIGLIKKNNIKHKFIKNG
jgi:hypothetical protein